MILIAKSGQACLVCDDTQWPYSFSRPNSTGPGIRPLFLSTVLARGGSWQDLDLFHFSPADTCVDHDCTVLAKSAPGGSVQFSPSCSRTVFLSPFRGKMLTCVQKENQGREGYWIQGKSAPGEVERCVGQFTYSAPGSKWPVPYSAWVVSGQFWSDVIFRYKLEECSLSTVRDSGCCVPQTSQEFVWARQELGPPGPGDSASVCKRDWYFAAQFLNVMVLPSVLARLPDFWETTLLIICLIS